MTPGSAFAPELMDELAERARSTDLTRLESQLRATGGCARPIRLKGKVNVSEADGRVRVWSTDSEPDGVLRKSCGNRREAVCPPCAERYRQDAWHLIAAGLRGGKGVPDSITRHPAVFVTLTASSFGVVHTRPLGPDGQPRRCRPRRDDPVCEHGVRLSCRAIHAEGDPCLGEPLCPRCFDYAGAVVWNHSLGALWRYTTIYVPRAMAAHAGMTQTALAQDVKPAYVKVAEYQRRGLVHLHVLARLDRAMPDYRADQLRPPDRRFGVELLEHGIRDAVADVSAPIAPELGGGRVRWGRQLDVEPLQSGEQRGEIAGYLAKYATKSTEQAGGLLHRVTARQVTRAPVSEHVRTLMAAGFVLDAIGTAHRARHAPPELPVPEPGADWDPAVLAHLARRMLGRDERVRLVLHDDTIHAGRITQMPTAPERDGTTLAVEMDARISVHLADVASIGPAQRRRRDPRLARSAHAFGYRGHCLTKSRRYSTTFKALREAREAYVHAQLLARSTDATQRAIAAATTDQRTASFACVGTGHLTAAYAFLAASAAARARERRSTARLVLAMES